MSDACSVSTVRIVGGLFFIWLMQQPQIGKQSLIGQLSGVTSAQYAVRDWILPFMAQFTDLLKVLWTLWTQLKTVENEEGATFQEAARLQGLMKTITSLSSS